MANYDYTTTLRGDDYQDLRAGVQEYRNSLPEGSILEIKPFRRLPDGSYETEIFVWRNV